MSLEETVSAGRVYPNIEERRELLELIRQDYNRPKSIRQQIDEFIGSIGNKISPVKITPEITEVAKKQTRSIYDFEIKGYALFDWFEHNFHYEKKRFGGYRNSQEAFKKKKGNCVEAAFLYIAMARSIGMESNFVDVKLDCEGERVQHACASIHGSRIILVDPAYHLFDVRHKEGEIYDELKMISIGLKII